MKATILAQWTQLARLLETQRHECEEKKTSSGPEIGARIRQRACKELVCDFNYNYVTLCDNTYHVFSSAGLLV